MKSRFITWIIIGIAAAVALFLGLWLSNHESAPANAKTVGEAVGELNGQDTNTDKMSSNLVSILNGLGIFEHSQLPAPAPSDSSETAEARAQLIDRLEQAISTGALTPSDADSVLKAFDGGIIYSDKSPLVVVDSGASS